MEKPRKFSGMRSLSNSLDGVTNRFFKMRGFAENKILTQWEHIAGKELAKFSTPRKLSFKKDKKSDGILHIEVYDSGMATEMTYIEPILIEKIAQYFGYKAVAKLKIIQRPGGFLEQKSSAYIKEKPIKLDVQTTKMLDTMVDTIEDEELKKILSSLGQRILSD